MKLKNNIKRGTKKIPELHKKLKKTGIRNIKNRKKNCDKVENFPVASSSEIINEKSFICETCHKLLYKSEIPCQVVCNKKALDPIYDELKD